MMRVVMLLIMVLTAGSCVNTEFYNENRAKVDSLSMALDSSSSAYESIDTALIGEQYLDISARLDTLIKYPGIAADTLVMNCNDIKKGYKTFLQEHALITQEINYSRNQLRALRHDIENRHLDEEEITAYFGQEKDAVKALTGRIENNLAAINRNIGKFNRMEPVLRALTDSVMKMNQYGE